MIPKLRLGVLAGKWWPSAQKEAGYVRELVALACVDLRLPISTTVLASDASEDGYGTMASVFSATQARSLARWRERWRYREEEVDNPRELALREFTSNADDPSSQAPDWRFPTTTRADLEGQYWWEMDSGPWK